MSDWKFIWCISLGYISASLIVTSIRAIIAEWRGYTDAMEDKKLWFRFFEPSLCSGLEVAQFLLNLAAVIVFYCGAGEFL